jgi:hypothetical protein
VTLTLYDVPPDVAGTLTAGGPSLTATIVAPGQNARIGFDGQAGQRISLKLSAVTISGSFVTILKPDGSAFVTNVYVGTGGSFVDTRTLPVAGSYAIVVDPQGTATGSMSLTLYDVPADASGSLVVGGPSLTVTMATPGQNARISFEGRAGQKVSLKLSAVTVSSSFVSILKPDGGTAVSQTFVSMSGRTITADVPADGTYAIVIDPQGAATGSMTLTLSPG